MEKLVLHRTIENHICMNVNCRNTRAEELLKSEFSGTSHYVSWHCGDCGNKNWWKTDTMSSGVRHIRL